jgi:ABC-2 type transport system permease protein
MTGHAITDSATMLRRSLRRMRRYPSLTLFIAGIPVVLLLLFVYVFGGTLGAGLDGPGMVSPPGTPRSASMGRDAYVAYVVPGILLLTIVGAAQGTAISVAMDMTAGIIARFRTMAIARVSVLAGHVVGSVVQALLATALVLVVAVVIGFRPTTAPAAWLAAGGLLVLAAVGIGWLSVALGLVSDSVETASNLPMFLMLLLFLSSGFVPAASMPGPLGWFAEHQPFTPIIETLRGLLLGTPVGDDGWLAVAWCLLLALAGYLWSRRLYERVPERGSIA